MKRLVLPIRIRELRESVRKHPQNKRLQNRLQNLLNQKQINEQLPTLKD